MKKRVLTITSLLTILGLLVANNGFGLFNKNIVYAIGDLTVSWETDPLFNETNIAPGFSQTKNVNVSNGAISARPVGVRGILNSDTGNLASVMNIEIKEGAAMRYSNTLAQFFAESAGIDGIFLSNLSAGNNTNYSFIITFDSSAGNEFQNQTIIFDLQIGISVDVPDECQNIEFSGNPIFGTSGNDRINGTSGNDLIITFEGNDKVFSHGGDDCIVGGEGNDELRGETQNDVIFGNSGEDLVIGAVGNDTLFGGEGNDVVRGENNDDEIFGNGGNDKITGGNGDDQIDAGEGADDVSSENGIDTILGGAGNDKLDGGAGNDNIHGNENDDLLNGKSGNDVLFGDEDTDIAIGHAGIDTCDAESELSCEL